MKYGFQTFFLSSSRPAICLKVRSQPFTAHTCLMALKPINLCFKVLISQVHRKKDRNSQVYKPSQFTARLTIESFSYGLAR